jgi:hypothetical protein
MVRAILEGRKTQTRRVISKQPLDVIPYQGELAGQRWVGLMQRDPNKGLIFKCKYGQAGDRLWVRETWQAQNTEMKWWHEWPANDRHSMNWAWTNPVVPAYEQIPPRWLSAIHMPRMACRITLEITGVRVERLQDISFNDALDEGMVWDDASDYVRMDYMNLWNKINAKRGYGWDVNPWVWVIEFKQVKR